MVFQKMVSVQTKEIIINKRCAIKGINREPEEQTSQSVQPTIQSTDLGTSSSRPMSTIWQEFDETVANMVQNQVDNPQDSSIIEIDKYLSMPLLYRE